MESKKKKKKSGKILSIRIIVLSSISLSLFIYLFYFYFFNFGSTRFGVGENHGKVKEQISRFDQLIKREWKKRKKRKRK